MKKQFIKPEIKLTDMEAQQIICASGITGAKEGGNTIIQYGGLTSSRSLQVD